MTFQESIKTCFKKYIVIDGRASRSEFWWFMLLYLVVIFILDETGKKLGMPNLILIVYVIFFSLIAVAIRRIHDSDNRGWWLLIAFFNLYFLARSGTPNDNRFGSPPTN